MLLETDLTVDDGGRWAAAMVAAAVLLADDAERADRAAHQVEVRLKVTKRDDDSALNQYSEYERVNSIAARKTKC